MDGGRRHAVGALALGALLAGRAGAQSAPSAGPPDMPASYRPPPGMCRVWLRDVPPVQQPAPTDCRSALRTKPSDAVVVFGPERRATTSPATGWTTRAEALDDPAMPPVRAVRDDDAPPELPAMRAAMQWIEGQRPPEMVRWLGARNVAARFTMPAGGRAPDRVQWVDADGRLVQLWVDRNGDGRADRVEIYDRDGARLRVIGN